MVLSPLVFGVVMDWVMRKAVGEGGEGVLVAPGTRVSDLDFADDVLLVGESLDMLRRAVETVEMEGAVFGLRLNLAKTKWMGSPGVGEGELMVGGKVVERVEALVYLGS